MALIMVNCLEPLFHGWYLNCWGLGFRGAIIRIQLRSAPLSTRFMQRKSLFNLGWLFEYALGGLLLERGSLTDKLGLIICLRRLTIKFHVKGAWIWYVWVAWINWCTKSLVSWCVYRHTCVFWVFFGELLVLHFSVERFLIN